jgi:hypothetical protein
MAKYDMRVKNLVSLIFFSQFVVKEKGGDIRCDIQEGIHETHFEYASVTGTLSVQ